jgi:hypothetical protein
MNDNSGVQLMSAVDSVIRVLDALKREGEVTFNEEAATELEYAKQMMENAHAS